MRVYEGWSAPARWAIPNLGIIILSASAATLSGDGGPPYGNYTVLSTGGTAYSTVSLPALSGGTSGVFASSSGVILPSNSVSGSKAPGSTLSVQNSTSPFAAPISTQQSLVSTQSSNSTQSLASTQSSDSTQISIGTQTPISTQNSNSTQTLIGTQSPNSTQIFASTQGPISTQNSTQTQFSTQTYNDTTLSSPGSNLPFSASVPTGTGSTLSNITTFPASVSSTGNSTNTSSTLAGVTIGIVTTVVVRSGVTVAEPIITGGGIFPPIVLPPATATLASAEAESAVSSISSQVALLIPVLNTWKTNPKSLKSDTLNKINGVRDGVEGVIPQLGDVPISKPCVRVPKQKRGIFGSLTKIVSSLSCIDENLDTITSHVNADDVQGIDPSLNELTSLNDDLADDADETQTDSKPGSGSPTRPSASSPTNTATNSDTQSITGTTASTTGTNTSSTVTTTSCTSSRTALRVTVQCDPITNSTAGLEKRILSTICTPVATMTISGCSVTATTTTISPSATPNPIAPPCGIEDCGDLCPSEGLKKGDSIPALTPAGNACDAVSTVTFTTLPTTSGGVFVNTPAAYSTVAATPEDLLPKRNALRYSEDDNNHSLNLLSKRVIPNDQGPRNAVVLSQSIQVNKRWLAITLASVVGVYVPYPNRDMAWGVKGLYGCTSVVVVSNKGLYLSHVYENPVFVDRQYNPTPDSDFRRGTLEAFRNGNAFVDSIKANVGTAAAPGGLHPSNHPIIYVMTPFTEDEERRRLGINTALRYDTRAKVLGSYVSNLVFGSGGSFTLVGYKRTNAAQSNNPNLLDGRNMLAFTPRQEVWTTFENDGTTPRDSITLSRARLWFTDSIADTRDWWNRNRAPGAQNVAGPASTCTFDFNSSVTLDTNSGYTESATLSVSTNSTVVSGSTTLSVRTNSTLIVVTTPASPITSPNSAPPSTTVSNTSHAITTLSGSITATATPTSTFSCNPYQNPHAGSASLQCECEGLNNGPFCPLSSTSGVSNFNPCGYTTSPTPCASTGAASPFTITQPDGEVVSCASSSYYDIGINTSPSCAGSTQVVSTVASLASAYSASIAVSISASSASAAAASASASYAAAAAVPSAACNILSDFEFGSSFEVYGINGWAGDGGVNLETQEDGCGVVDDFDFETNTMADFDGKPRDAQLATFGLSFFKGGCVERAVHSAGGPPPGHDPGQLACQHVSNLNAAQLAAANRITNSQVVALGAIANGSRPVGVKGEAVASGATAASLPTASIGPDLRASASAALPKLLAVQSSLSAAVAAAAATAS